MAMKIVYEIFGNKGVHDEKITQLAKFLELEVYSGSFHSNSYFSRVFPFQKVNLESYAII